MELEELKNEWQEMSKEIENQKILTDKLIIDMTQEKFNKRLSSISIPESVGAIICAFMALYIIFNFYKLDIWYLEVCGALSIAYLILLPFYVLKSIKGMKKINIAVNSLKQTILDFSKRKNQFWFAQRIGFYLNFLFIIAILPVFGKLFKDKDLFLSAKLWYWYIPAMFVFLIVFSIWGLKHYKKATTDAENLLKDLEG